jgi:hypothetical protein
VEVQVASKSQFAALAGVSAGRVSQWITEGKITEDEMEGTGRNAKIKVGPACARLKLKLDAAQRLGNGLRTNLSIVSPLPITEQQTQKPEPQGAVDKLDLQLKEQKLKQAEAQNRKLEEDERARRGLYVRTQDASAETAKITGTILQMFEGGLADVAAEIAAEYKLPARDVIHLMRKRFREVRAKISGQLADEAEQLPILIDDIEA